MKSMLKNKLKKRPKLYLITVSIYSKFIIFLNYIISVPLLIFKIRNNKIVICNYFGKGYGDNGKYIAEEIIKQGLKYDLVWLLREELIGMVEFPAEVRVVKYGSIKGLYELSTAKVWIDNSRKFFYPIKRKDQYYIQTWHGGIALKKIEKDAANVLSKDYINAAKIDSKMADLFISNSEFCTNMYKNAFWYDKEIYEIGSPRCDILFSNQLPNKKKVRNYYKINKEEKILLYAPTFRNNQSTDIYSIDYNSLLRILEEKFKSKWVILVRLHPNISSESNFMKYSTNIINASEYDDMYELLSASDILITDYSSTMFEFSFMKKPVFLYTPDIEDYKRDRNFYFKIENLPYKIAKSDNELQYTIKNFDENEYLKKLSLFLEQLNLFEKGQASKKLVDRIEQVVNLN